jgi:hypothetical protein
MFSTTDMSSVYDESLEGFVMCIRLSLAAAFSLTLASSALIAQGDGANSGSSQGAGAGARLTQDSRPMPESMGQNKIPSGPLTISYNGQSSQWTAATLAALPHTTLTLFNEHAKANQTYSGVLLTDLLTPLGVPNKPHGKDFRIYLLAEGSDGYQVVYSGGEVTPDVHDGTVLVADSVDGKPIGGEGPLKLVATGEKRPARWVRNLVAIRVETAK